MQSTEDTLKSQANASLIESAFLRSCKLQPTDYTPVWVMRQAGRYMKSFREIRKRLSFLELCKDPGAASEVTVMAVERLGVDAAIIFADILLPLEPMGVGLEFVESKGPQVPRPVTSAADVNSLKPIDAGTQLAYVMEAIKITRSALPAGVPLLGFAAAPFTLAAYMIEGGVSKNFEKTKTFMYSQSAAFKQLLDYIAAITVDYLNCQIAAGADAVQLFDSHVGALSVSDYQSFVAPSTKKVFAGIAATTPTIHFGTNTASQLKQLKAVGGNVIGLDWRCPLNVGWAEIGYDRAVQGNLDPIVLLSDKEQIKTQVARILSEANCRPGHIFNLGHGVLPSTNEDHVKYLVEQVHTQSRKLREAQ